MALKYIEPVNSFLRQGHDGKIKSEADPGRYKKIISG
jgi:hypothetical protein